MEIKDFEKLFDSKLERIHDKLGSILEQTTKHNGRMTKLENETEVVRMFSKYPKLTVLIGIGLMTASSTGIGFLIGLI